MPRRDTRTAILAAAVTILGRDGPDGFSAAALAREVGVSKATLFHHFATIDEIPIEAFERLVSQTIDIAPPPEGASLGDIVSALGGSNFALVDARREFIRTYFVFIARAMFDPRLAALVKQSGDVLLERMRQLLRPHLASDADAAAFARLLAIFLDGQGVHLMAFEDRAEIEAAWRLFVRLAETEWSKA